MGGTRYPNGQSPPRGGYGTPCVTRIEPQKNIYKTKYPSDFGGQLFPRGSHSFPALHSARLVLNSSPYVPPPASDYVWRENIPSSDLCSSPPIPNVASSSEPSQESYQSIIGSSQYMTQYPPPPPPSMGATLGLLRNHHIYPPQPHYSSPYPPPLYNSGPTVSYFMAGSTSSSEIYSNSSDNQYMDQTYLLYNSEQPGWFHAEGTTDVYGFPRLSPLVTIQQQPQQQQQQHQQSVQDSYGCLSTSLALLPSQTQTHSQAQFFKKMNAVEMEACLFVQSSMPLLGERPYCLPPVKRSKHPDKSIKQLAVGMESEKRVFGSFERFFAERQVPVVMLCHYPMAGFMQVYKHEMSSPDRELISLPGEHSKGVLPLLLLSDNFGVVLVTVSIVSGNSDFTYIQKGVQKAVAHIRRCSRAVARWLTFLGVSLEVRQVIAFPNLRRSVLQRITKDKQFQESLASVCTLHVDDLSAPFEQEWSTPEHKHRFSLWMQDKVMCQSPTLSREGLKVVVGALLSPRLSKVEFVQDQVIISPLSELSAMPDDVSDNSVEDVSQLLLTIDGVTKPFDVFMNEYVMCYYPNLDEETYRVPPIHFNIQSLRKPAEYIKVNQDSSFTIRLVPASEEVPNQISSSPESGYSTEVIQEGQIDRHGTGEAQTSSEGFMSHGSSRHPSPDVLRDRDSHSLSSSDCHSVGDGSCHAPRDAVCQSPTEGDGHSLKDGDRLSATEHLQVPGHEHNPSHVLSNLVSLSLPPEHLGHTVAESDVKLPESKESLQGNVQIQTTSYTSQTSHSEPSSGDKSVAKTVCQVTSVASVCPKAWQDVDILSEIMTKDVRADEGENRVIGALERLGQHFGPMFIICDYQYNNYLNKLREEMFSKGETRRPIRAFGQTMRAEHDCLILHKKYGVLIVCIKAIGDNFRDWGASEEQKITSTNKILEKAVKQLDREEAMVRHVTADLDPRLPCHKLIALPNMSRDSVVTALAADSGLAEKIHKVVGHGTELFLCSDELPPKFRSAWDDESGSEWKKLVGWWNQVEQLLMTAGGELTSRIYRQIVGRYCGLLSTVEVWSSTNPRVEIRNVSEAISECAGRFCKLVLLPRQLEALCSNNRWMFLYGPPGSGKTLILTLKARQWLLAGEKVILVNSRPGCSQGYPHVYGVYSRLQRMMAQLKVTSCHLLMISVDSLNFRAEDLAGIMPSCCIIMDEVSPSCHDIIEHFSCLQVKYIWCAGLFEEDRPKTDHIFATYKMDKIIRCPPVIQSIMKYTEPDVKLQMPYRDTYQSHFLGTSSPSGCQTDATSSTCQKASSQDDNGVWYSKSETKETNVLPKTTTSSNDNIDVAAPSGDRSSLLESSHRHTNEAPPGNSDHKEQAQNVEEENQASNKYDPDSLNRRLQLKYNSDLLNKRFEKKYDSESLNQRLKENYSHGSVKVRPQKKCDPDSLYDPSPLNQRLQKYGEQKQVVRQEGPQVVRQEGPQVVRQEGPQVVRQEGPQVVRQEGPQVVRQEGLQVVRQEGPQVVRQEEPQVVRQEEPHTPEHPVPHERMSYCSSSAEIGLPTDGPRPYFIDHRSHSQPGNPQGCYQCGYQVAQVLESLIKPSTVADVCNQSPLHGGGKNRLSLRITSPGAGRIRISKSEDSKLLSSSSLTLSGDAKSNPPAGQKLSCPVSAGVLSWSDVLIVAGDMPQDSAFVAALRDRHIPTEVVPKKHTFQIEDTQMRTVFITQYKEATGLERPLIVFVPSVTTTAPPPDPPEPSCHPGSVPDLHLPHSLGRYSAEDRVALWHMVSRSLASVVLILP